MTINWLFGRGLSIDCKLVWTVPKIWRILPRHLQICLIKNVLRKEMNKQYIDTRSIKRLLEILADRTVADCRHRFITTNWDYLLQQEIFNLELEVQPPWMANSHVYHLNGSVEKLDDESNRSPFLLEQDLGSQRHFTPEANVAYNYMTIGRLFVIVGMSFECQTDKFLLAALNRVENNLPIGESTWIIIEPNPDTLGTLAHHISQALPAANINPVCETFSQWVNNGMQELSAHGAIQ